MRKLPPWSDEYRQAVAELVQAIGNGGQLIDAELESLVEAQAGPDNRKALIMGLKALELISEEQAAFAIGYRWPDLKAG